MDNEEENDTLSSLDGQSRALPSNSSLNTASRAARPSSTATARKAYAGRSGRELSTSAAKRQSVMALGSIKHLQHMYAKNGLASSSPLSIGSSGKPLPLALPGQVIPSNDILESQEEKDFPPSPSPPAQNMDRSFDVEIPSSRLQRRAVYRELAEVCEKWGLVEMDKFLSSRRQPSTASASSTPYESSTRESLNTSPMPSDSQQDNLILSLMQTTTAAIRAAQKYFLTLPPEKLPYGNAKTGNNHNKETSSSSSSSNRGPPSALGIITASRPIPRHSMMGVASSSRRPVSPTRDKEQNASPDPLLRLRKVSLATLGALKEMEARYRVPMSDEVHIEHLNDSIQDLSLSSNDSTYSHPSLHIEDTCSSEISTSSSTASKGHLYQANVSLTNLNKEAQIVKEWIETVDNLLSDLTTDAAKTPRPRTKSGNLAVETSPIPKWARIDAFENDKLGRLRACLQNYLQRDLARHLPPNGSASDLLTALSDGQLLCSAYNAILRASQRPWGFIPENSIHDVISLTRQREEAEQALAIGQQASLDDSTHLQVGGSTMMRRQSSDGMGIESFTTSSDTSAPPDGSKPRIGLTFRRFENLRVFVAALKLRYLVQIRAEINIKSIARKEEGWQEMLEEIAVQWVEAAAEEKRNEDPDSE